MEDEAVKLGAEFFSEILVVFVGISGVVAELTRKHFSDKAAAEKQRLIDLEIQATKERRAVEKEKALRERLLKLESTLMEMENSKLELLHDKIVQDQLHHLELTEQALARIDALESFVGYHPTVGTETSEEKMAVSKERLLAARPGALPNIITQLGSELIQRESELISDPTFGEKFITTEYAEQEARVQAALALKKEMEKEAKEKEAKEGQENGKRNILKSVANALTTSTSNQLLDIAEIENNTTITSSAAKDQKSEKAETKTPVEVQSSNVKNDDEARRESNLLLQLPSEEQVLSRKRAREIAEAALSAAYSIVLKNKSGDKSTGDSTALEQEQDSSNGEDVVIRVPLASPPKVTVDDAGNYVVSRPSFGLSNDYFTRCIQDLTGHRSTTVEASPVTSPKDSCTEAMQ